MTPTLILNLTETEIATTIEYHSTMIEKLQKQITNLKHKKFRQSAIDTATYTMAKHSGMKEAWETILMATSEI